MGQGYAEIKIEFCVKGIHNSVYHYRLAATVHSIDAHFSLFDLHQTFQFRLRSPPQNEGTI